MNVDANDPLMKMQQSNPPINNQVCLVPTIKKQWTIDRVPNSDQIVLKSSQNNSTIKFFPNESFAIQHLNGQYTVSQIQHECENKFLVDRKFTVNLLKKLIELDVLDFCLNSQPEVTKTNLNVPQNLSLIHI